MPRQHDQRFEVRVVCNQFLAPSKYWLSRLALVLLVTFAPRAMGADTLNRYRDHWIVTSPPVYSPDGSMVAHGVASGKSGAPGAVFLSRFELKLPVVEIPVSEPRVEYLAISRDNKLVAAICFDLSEPAVEDWTVHLRCWQVADAKLLFDFPIPRTIKYGAMHFNGDGTTLYMLNTAVVRVFDIAQRTFTASFTCENASSRAFDVSLDGKWIAVPGAGANAVNLYETQTHQLKKSFKLSEKQRIDSCKFSPDGRWIAARDDREFIHVWSTEKPDVELRKLRHGTAVPYIFSPDSQAIVVEQRGELRVINLETGERILKGKIPLAFGEVVFPRFDPDSKKLFATGYYPDCAIFEVSE